MTMGLIVRGVIVGEPILKIWTFAHLSFHMHQTFRDDKAHLGGSGLITEKAQCEGHHYDIAVSMATNTKFWPNL